jgi:hypothetical protein
MNALETIFLRIAPADIAFVKFLFESYEEVAIVRTLDRRAAIIVALVSADFLHIARGILDSIRDAVAFEEIAPPADAGEDWLIRLMRAETD